MPVAPTTVDLIVDATTAGKALLNAADAAAQAEAINAVAYAEQSLSDAARDQFFSNTKECRVCFLLKWGAINATIATVARTSNVATITTSTHHGMIVGQKVRVNAVTDNTFDAFNTAAEATVLSVPTTTSFTYANTGVDKAQTADSGSLSSWEVTDESNHSPIRNARLSSIATSGVTVTWDALPAGTWTVSSCTFGNHVGNANGSYTPIQTGVGLNTCGISMLYRKTLFGRVYWNGTTTGGGASSNTNWVKEGDTQSIAWATVGGGVLFIGHTTGATLPTSGSSRGACQWPVPILQATGAKVRPALPNYQVSPFTAAGYRPSATGFYCQLYSPAGTLLDQAALEALSPTTEAQLMWQRTVDTTLADHTLPDFAATTFCTVTFKRID